MVTPIVMPIESTGANNYEFATPVVIVNPDGSVAALGGGGGGSAPVGAALDGTDATGITPPSGAVGIRGWLSGIYARLAGTLTVALPTGAATDATLGGKLDTLNATLLAAPKTTASSASTNGNVASVTTGTAGNLLAASANRSKYTIQNDSTAVAYVLEGPGIASASNFSVQIAPSGFYATTEWAGAVSIAWASANGAARWTQYTVASGGAPGTSAGTSVTAATAATPLLAANANRKRYSLFNSSTATAYVLEGSGTVLVTSYTIPIAPGSYYNTTEWLGAVSAIWSAANGSMSITEYTA